MERAAFLARLRERLVAPAATSHSAHPVPSYAGTAVPRYCNDLTDLPAVFTVAAEALGAVVRRVPPGGLPELLGEVVATHQVGRAVVSRDPETAGAVATLEALGVLVGGADAAADLGVTGAVCGIAATGSVVVAADRAGGRTTSLLPPVHVALVSMRSLLATPTDLWRQLPRHFPGGLPSQVVVITGPSRTSDIELVLVRGVHGPGQVWVGLLEDE
jgi:L-lactate dehydrogenase complex protein LldG